MVSHQQLQSVSTRIGPVYGDNARLMERIFGPFLVEKELRMWFLIHPGDKENGNNDFHPHVKGRDAVGRGDVTATILRARGASRMEAEPQRSSPQTSKYAAVWDRQPQAVRLHRNIERLQDRDGVRRRSGAPTVGRSLQLPASQRDGQARGPKPDPRASVASDVPAANRSLPSPQLRPSQRAQRHSGSQLEDPVLLAAELRIREGGISFAGLWLV